MAQFKRFQNSFLSGEIDPEFLLRGDAATANQSCRKARNVAIGTGGGAIRRPGSRLLEKKNAKTRYHFFRSRAGETIFIGFRNGSAQRINPATGAVIQSVAGPWAEADIDRMALANGNGGVYICSASFFPQFLVWDDTAADIFCANIAFEAGPGGTKRQPYYRFGLSGVTVSIIGTTATFSDDVLVAGHVGARFRRGGKEFQIDVVNSPTSATITLLEELYPTFGVPVADASNFKVGSLVSGSETGYRGEVTSIVSNTVYVLRLDGYDPFFYDSSTPANSEKLVGTEGTSQITGAMITAANAPALNWDEQMISAARGYPQACVVHNNRLCLGGFPEARNAIAVSAIGQFENFEVKNEPAASDGFIESIGIDDVEVRHLASLQNFFVLTNRGTIYVPENESPFAPGSVRFVLLGPEGASYAAPAVVTEGLVYCDISGAKIMAIVPTGLLQRPWDLQELSQAAGHLISNPTFIYAVSSADTRRFRMIFVVNDDGTVATLSYLRFTDFVGWALWSREGATFESLAIDNSDVYFAFKRGSDYPLCKLSWSTTLDEAVSYSAAATAHASTAVTLSWNQHFYGRYTLDGSGLITDVTPASGLEVGFDFTVEIEPFPPYDAERGRNPTRVTRLWAHIYQTGAFKCDGEYWAPYKGGDDPTIPPTVRTEEVDFYLFDNDTMLGSPPITQDECAPFHLQALTMEGRF